MPFKKGNRHPNQGGPRPNSGRPTLAQVEERKAAQQIAKEMLDARVRPIMTTFLNWAEGGIVPEGVCPQVNKQAVAQFLPPVQQMSHSGSVVFLNSNVPDDTD